MNHSLTYVLVCLTVCLPSLGWANDDLTVEGGTRPRALSVPASGAIFETSMASTFVMAPYASTRLRDLSPETDSPRIKGLVAKMNWLKDTIVTETEIANSYGGTGWLDNRMTGDSRTDPSKQMMRLGLMGITGTFKYGVAYRYAGQAFFNAPDQSTREVWGEWKTSAVTLRSAAGQLWNNVAEDTTRPRMMQTYSRLSMGLTKPSWPELTLTYARNSLVTLFEPIGIIPQRTQSHTLEGAMGYQSLRWNVRLSSSYALTSDLLRGGAQSNVRAHLLTASFRPINTVIISPMVGYREEIQDTSGIRIDSPSASLALQYKQSRRLFISATANYATSRSNDRQIDSENVGGKGSLMWDVQQSSEWSTLIAIEAGYTRASNRVMPSADTEDISGLVRLVVAEL